jgi:hypothetical protein
MTSIKHLISPFALWLPHTPPPIAYKALSRPMCNCDSDDENDFGMAPECAFVCDPFNKFTKAPIKRTTKKRHPHSRAKKTHTKRIAPRE